MHRRNGLALAGLAFLLAGCAHLLDSRNGDTVRTAEVPVPVVVEVPATDDAPELVELVSYGLRVARMSAEQQKRELAESSRAYRRDKGVYERVRLALLLSLPRSAINDDARAMSLLEPFANAGPRSGALRQYAALLYGNIAERLRSERRAEQLKEQLEALRAVERSMIERGLESQPRKP